MRRKKNLLILGGVLAVLLVVAIAEFVVKRHVDKINNTDKVVLSIESDDVTEVSWDYENKSLDFKKTDGTWKDADDDTFPVNQDKITEFLDNFSSVHASFVIDDVEDYEQYGLQNPNCTVTITTKDGDKTTITMGDFSTMDSERYISLGDDKVYLIDTDLMEQVSSEKNDFMQQDELGDYDTLTSFVMTGANKLDIVYDEDGPSYSDSYSYYLKDGEEEKALDSSLTETYLANITGQDLTDYVTYTATKSDLAQYNLNDPIMTIKVDGVKTEDSDSDDTDSADSDSEDTDASDSSDSSDSKTSKVSYTLNISKKANKYYANVEGSSIIYHLDSEVYDALKDGSYDTLRPSEVFSLDWSKVTKLTFTIDDKSYDIDVTHKNGEDTYKLGDEKLEFDDVITAVNALTINQFEDKDPDKQLEMSMSVTVKADDDKDSTQTLEVGIYRYDGDNCRVVCDGENVGLLDRSLMVDLKEAVETIVLNQ